MSSQILTYLCSFSYNFFASIDGNTFMERTNNLPVSITNIRYIAISNTNPNKVWYLPDMNK
jgi:hypothetical protein